MKRTLSIMLALGLILFCSGLASAADVSGVGVIALTDATGGGPGIDNISISLNAYASYSGAATAGAFAGAPTAGEVMCVTSGSTRPRQTDAIVFAVRGSNDPDCADDNRVYQISCSSSGASIQL